MKIAERLDVVLERHLPARTGTAFRVDAGDYIRIVDLQGEQAADFWAFHENDLNEYLSASRPSPSNIWTNFHLHSDGTFEIRRPESKAGDHILLRAEMPSVIGISACPQDITLTCGQRPTDLQIQVLR